MISLSDRPKILDIGCGKCGLLAKLVEETNGTGIGVDLPDSLANNLTEEAEALRKMSRIELVFEDATEFLKKYRGHGFDLVVCVGSSHSLNGYKTAIPQIKNVLRPGGYLLLGELTWAKKPSVNFLAFLDSTEADQPFSEEISEGFFQQQLPIAHSFPCTIEEFDGYENAFKSGILKWCVENSADPDAASFRNRINSWAEARTKWGREEFGFNVYLAGPK